MHADHHHHHDRVEAYLYIEYRHLLGQNSIYSGAHIVGDMIWRSGIIFDGFVSVARRLYWGNACYTCVGVRNGEEKGSTRRQQ